MRRDGALVFRYHTRIRPLSVSALSQSLVSRAGVVNVAGAGCIRYRRGGRLRVDMDDRGTVEPKRPWHGSGLSYNPGDNLATKVGMRSTARTLGVHIIILNHCSREPGDSAREFT